MTIRSSDFVTVGSATVPTATRNSHPPQLATRNPNLATLNSDPVTRNPPLPNDRDLVFLDILVLRYQMHILDLRLRDDHSIEWIFMNFRKL